MKTVIDNDVVALGITNQRRFLEHSRIVCFGNGGQIEKLSGRVFISSADWMDRNLNRRVELIFFNLKVF